MAVTRIKNNQITDASGANTQLGVNAAVKLQNYSVTAGKLANSLVYGSDLTVSGNLTVNGTTTTVDTINTLIKDPILTLADGQTSGTPTVDIGLLGLRGANNSSFLGWQESGQTFMAILSNTTASNTTVNVTSYANFTASNITAQGNLSIVGNIIGSANFTGNVTAGNLLTPGLVSATGNATAGNILTGGLISATGNATAGNVLTAGIVSATSNIITAGALNGATLSLSGNVTSTLNVTGNINVGNVTNLGISSTVGNVIAGNVTTVGLVSATGNVTGGNINTAGLASVTGNVIGGNFNTAGLISAAGNITSATNVNTPNVVGASGLTVSTGSGNINLSPTSGNIVVNSTYINGVAQPVQSNDVATKIYVDNMVSTQIAYHQAVTAATIANLATTTGGTITYNNGANGIGANITTTGSFNLIDTANVQTANTRILVKNEGNAALNGVYVWSNATVITRSSDADQYGPSSSEELSINDYFFVTSGNVNAGSAWIVDAPSGVITFGTSNIAFAQFSSSQTYTGGNGISLYGTVISTVYDNSTIGVNGSNQLYIPANAPLTTPNIGAATGTSLSVTGDVTANTNISAVGTVIGGNITTVGTISATGNITTAAALNTANLSLSGNVLSALNVTGNIAGGNILTPGLFSATGNATAGNINTAGLASVTGNVIGGNISTAGLITATGNATAGNINTAGLVSATGNIYGGNLILTGAALDTSAARLTVNSTSADADFAVNGDTVANVFYVDAGTGTASFGSATQTTNALVSFNSSTSILLPVGNTSVRPSVGATGMLRFNTTNNGLEIYDNSEWTPVGTTTFTVIADEQFNGDGSTVAFTLASEQTTNSCLVSINGVVQIPTSAYSVSTTTLTFTEAPAAGDLIDVREITTTTSVTAISNNSGNSTITGNTSAAQMDVLGNLVPTGNAAYDLGSATNYWKSLYVGGSTIYLGGLQLKSATGNVFQVFASDGTTPATLGNVILSTTGNVTGGNANFSTGNVTLGNIINGNGNGVGNIGNSSSYFNTVFAKATSAQYADLAEKYVADQEYAPGTVVSFGGEKEVTRSEVDADRAVAGVVSTNPSYIMNATLEAEHVAVVAFTGRVPTSVTGAVSKGDLMVSNGDGTARAEADPKAGSIIGKALENFAGDTGTIEVVIGRF